MQRLDTITIPASSQAVVLVLALASDINVTVSDANVSVTVSNPGISCKWKQITILGNLLGATDGADDIVVNGNAATVGVSTASGSKLHFR